MDWWDWQGVLWAAGAGFLYLVLVLGTALLCYHFFG